MNTPSDTAALTRPATSVEAALVERALLGSRRGLWAITAILAIVTVLLTAVATAEESWIVGALFFVVAGAFTAGAPLLFRRALQQRSTGSVEVISGALTQVPDGDPTYGALLGTARINVPSHWWLYLPREQTLRAEGVRVDVPGRPPVYHVVTVQNPAAADGPLSLEREAKAGLARSSGVSYEALMLLGTPLFLAGLALAAIFSGIGRRPLDAAWAAGWACVAAAGCVMMFAGMVPLVRQRLAVWTLYQGPKAPPLPVFGRTAWTAAAWGAAIVGAGLLMFGVPLWAGVLLGGIGFLPVGVFLGFTYSGPQSSGNSAR